MTWATGWALAWIGDRLQSGGIWLMELSDRLLERGQSGEVG